MIDNTYQDLLDGGFSEAAIERQVGEGWSLEELLQEAVDRGFFDTDDQLEPQKEAANG